MQTANSKYEANINTDDIENGNSDDARRSKTWGALILCKTESKNNK